MNNESKNDSERVEAEIIKAEKNEAPSIRADVVDIEKPQKKAFYKRPKFILFLILFFLIIAGIVWLVRVFNVYTNSKKYEEAYDKLVDQLEYCRGIKGEAKTEDEFIYCNKLEETFKDIKR